MENKREQAARAPAVYSVAASVDLSSAAGVAAVAPATVVDETGAAADFSVISNSATAAPLIVFVVVSGSVAASFPAFVASTFASWAAEIVASRAPPLRSHPG